MRVSAETPLSLRDLRILASRTLKAAGIDNAEREAMWLLARALNTGDNALLSEANQIIAPPDAVRAWTYIRRRAAREPLQYILGTQEFRGHDFSVTDGVFIPRPETECLVDETVARVGIREARVADVGTGSGCVGVAIAAECPQATIYAIDISARALAVAQANAARCGVRDRIRFVQGDLLEPFAGAVPAEGDGIFAVIVSNPPYIPNGQLPGLQPEIAHYEPSIALMAGPDGLAYYRRILRSAGPLLKPGGYLILELGFGQAEAVKGLAGAFPLIVLECRKDEAGIERVLVMQKAV